MASCPVAQGVATYAALDRRARELMAAGDERGRGQIMADTRVERVTGQSSAEAVPVEVTLVMPLDALVCGDDAGELVGQGPVAAPTARALLAAAGEAGAPIWLRRVFASADGSDGGRRPAAGEDRTTRCAGPRAPG